jgi:methylphosphotriester-DNA--protein-cysteine methyltransferase
VFPDPLRSSKKADQAGAMKKWSKPPGSRSPLSRLTGTPVHRYHLRARMTAALDEVLDSSRDFTTIGIDLGFSSHSHFTATFRRTFGITPSALRRHANVQHVIRSSNFLTATPAARP